MAQEHCWRFELEFDGRPPSVNHLYKQARNGRKYMTAQGKAFKELVGVMTTTALRRETRVPEPHDLWAIDVWIEVPRRKLYIFDEDNCWKVLLDGIADALGIDDRYMMDQRMRKRIGDTEKTVVSLWQIIPDDDIKPKPHTAKARRRKKT